jgi:hypothetical protein
VKRRGGLVGGGVPRGVQGWVPGCPGCPRAGSGGPSACGFQGVRWRVPGGVRSRWQFRAVSPPRWRICAGFGLFCARECHLGRPGARECHLAGPERGPTPPDVVPPRVASPDDAGTRPPQPARWQPRAPCVPRWQFWDRNQRIQSQNCHLGGEDARDCHLGGETARNCHLGEGGRSKLPPRAHLAPASRPPRAHATHTPPGGPSTRAGQQMLPRAKLAPGQAEFPEAG